MKPEVTVQIKTPEARPTAPRYAAPRLTAYGPVAALTASGTKPAKELAHDLTNRL